MTVYAAGPGLVPSRGPGGRAPQPPPQGRNTPRPGATTPPNKKSAGPRSEGAKRTSGGGGPGPRNQEARRRHCGGAARSAKRAGARAGGATTSVPTSDCPHHTTSSVNHQLRTQPLGARGPKPPKPCTDTSPGHRDRRGIQRTPDEVPSGPSSPHTPACGSRGPRRGTASRG